MTYLHVGVVVRFIIPCWEAEAALRYIDEHLLTHDPDCKDGNCKSTKTNGRSMCCQLSKHLSTVFHPSYLVNAGFLVQIMIQRAGELAVINPGSLHLAVYPVASMDDSR